MALREPLLAGGVRKGPPAFMKKATVELNLAWPVSKKTTGQRMMAMAEAFLSLSRREAPPGGDVSPPALPQIVALSRQSATAVASSATV
jgi:hypothetical protein